MCQGARRRSPSFVAYIGIPYTFARRRGHGPPARQHLTQGVSLHLLQNRALKRADPLKGKFRSFLLASFQNFLSDETSRARCQKTRRQPWICFQVPPRAEMPTFK